MGGNTPLRDEEERAIIPAIDRARKEGMLVVGPVGADSVFHFARIGRYRAVLCFTTTGHIAARPSISREPSP
jgi:4-hydroxythreonine-4-phosphate dehydrogenase